MSKSITTIKKNVSNDKNIAIILLSAGVGQRIKSNEPRSLIKIKNKCLIEHQIETIKTVFKNPEIIGVFGPYIERIIKRYRKEIRIVENQLYKTTNNSESLRLGLNNTQSDDILFIHGDIFFNSDLFEKVDFSKSFIILDANQDMKDKEIGATMDHNKISILSYGLDKKWCQICFLTGKEIKILRSIFLKANDKDKKMLTFELINQIIKLGGSFAFHEKIGSRVVEIDCIKDTINENFNM